MKKHYHLLHQGHRICVTVRTSGSCFRSRKYEMEGTSRISGRTNRAFPRKKKALSLCYWRINHRFYVHL